LIEALEARMAFRVRSTSGTPKPLQQLQQQHASGSSSSSSSSAVGGNGSSRPAAGSAAGALEGRSSSVSSPDVTQTLPADSLSSRDEDDGNAAAVEQRAQRAAEDILEK
jgi:hypothetical protein